MSASPLSVIRPNLPPAPGPQATAPQLDQAKLAAQRAFFAAALARTAPAAQAQPAPTAAAGPGTSLERPAEAPRKILRPGSVLDIRV
jgi:hypothetical protein